MFHKKLTWACDLIIINACCMTALQAWLMETNWLWGLSLLNCLAIISLRHWLMNCLQIPWLDSWLNRGLKRATDIVVALTFLLTLFPLIIIIQAFAIRTNKQYHGALLCLRDVHVGDDKNFKAYLFRNCSTEKRYCLGMTPLAFQLLKGTISLSDLPAITIMPAEEDENNEVTEDAFLSEPYQEDAEDAIETGHQSTGTSGQPQDYSQNPHTISNEIEEAADNTDYNSGESELTVNHNEGYLKEDENSTEEKRYSQE